jgi:signal transduction histidine kinase
MSRKYIGRMRSFRAQLFTLVLLVIVPSFLLVLFSNFQRQQSEKDRARERAVTLAKLAASTQSHYIKETRQILGTIVQFPFLVLATNRAFCEWHLNNLKLISPDFNDFGFIEPSGKVFCHTYSNLTAQVSAESIESMLRKTDFALGDFVPAGVLPEAALQFGFPARGTNGEIIRVMFASLKIPPLSSALAELPLPEGGVINVIAPSGRVIARYPDPDHFVGQRLDSSDLLQRGQAGETVFESGGLDGVTRLYAVSSVLDGKEPLFSVVVGIPRQASFATANSVLVQSLIVMGAVAALLLWVAWWFSDRIFLRPVNAILQAAERVTHGDLSARTGISERKSELHLLAGTFDEMAATLQMRQLEIVQQNAELERRVQERTKELATLNGELEAFSYSVSHDLRAPLRHMNGFAQLLMSEPRHQSDPQTIRYLERITTSANHMGALIDDLLSFSRMARQSMLLAEVDSAEMVSSLIKELSASDEPRKIDWKISALPKVKGDAAMLRQVWLNLISNALKYTRGRNPAVIEICARAEAGETIFSIADNGAGFDMAYADKLFGVFQRLHREDEFEGTGIGLANVRRITQRHGGRTWAQGEIGKGATFFFSLKS